MDNRQFVGYPEVLKTTGVSKPTLLRRIERAGIMVYRDGTDRRRRLIDARDLPRLTDPRPVDHIEPAREFDGSAA